MNATTANTFHISMTTKIQAMALVAAALGFDLTTLRCAGHRVKWERFHGGDHIITDSFGGTWAVDLVLESVKAVA